MAFLSALLDDKFTAYRDNCLVFKDEHVLPRLAQGAKNFIAITAKSGDNIGQFIFPKSVLADNGIITQNDKDGKRGIRVYPKWDTVTNKQAEKTQSWQTKYFVTIDSDNFADLDLTKKILNKTNEN